MRNARLDEAQAGIKIARRNINNLRYADDTTLMAEREEKNLLIKVKEKSEKAGLKHDIQKTKISPASQRSQLFGRIALTGTRRQEAGLLRGLAILSRPVSVPSLAPETG